MKKRHFLLPIIAASFTQFSHAAEQDNVCLAKEYQVGLRYQQQSAEIKALQLQTYRLAQQRLQTIVKEQPNDHSLAIVVDLDETVLDNTPLLVRDMENCHDYTSWDTWADWEIHGHPTLIPGAKAFLNFADKSGVNIFYVSNRYDENKNSTIKTLNHFSLPQVSKENVLLYKLSKKQRRESIRKNHKIVMLLGDSLPDLSAEFKNKKGMSYNQDLVAKEAHHFGVDWFVFPNASYGSWDKAPLTKWNHQ